MKDDDIRRLSMHMAQQYFAGSVHRGEELKAREAAYAQGYYIGATTGRRRFWRVAHVDGKRWRTIDGLGLPVWATDPELALTFTLREHADAFAGVDADDVQIEEAF